MRFQDVPGSLDQLGIGRQTLIPALAAACEHARQPDCAERCRGGYQLAPREPGHRDIMPGRAGGKREISDFSAAVTCLRRGLRSRVPRPISPTSQAPGVAAKQQADCWTSATAAAEPSAPGYLGQSARSVTLAG